MNKDKLLESAQKFVTRGQLAKAISEYQKIVEAYPRDFRNRQKLAELLTRERRHDEARPHYEAVAKHFTETGFHLKAVAIYKQMQKAEPGREEIYLRLAELYAKHGLIGNALNEYRSLVSFYDRHRQPRESVEVLHKMVAIDPANLAVRSQLIDTLLGLDEAVQAAGQYRELIALLDDRGEYGNVVKCYEKFTALCPADFDHRLLYAKALLLSGQPDRALPLLKALDREFPGQGSSLSLLADCYLALGRHGDACAACLQLLDTQPTNPGLRERYLRLCIDGGNVREAVNRLEAWHADFASTGRSGVFRELCLALQVLRPDNPRLQKLLATLEDADDEHEVLLDEAPAEPLAAGTPPDDRAAAVTLEEEPSATPAALDLGLVLESPPADAAGRTADGAVDDATVELELEFEIEPHEGKAAATPLDAAPGEEAAAAAAPAGAAPPFATMVLPDFCELGLDLELSEDADDAAGAGAVAAAPVTPGDGEPEPLVEELEPLAARHGLHGQLEADPVASPALPGGEADEESQSHYDLGIAYKEMGMLAEAVAEFTAAARDTSRSVDCLTLMAQCRLQMGDAAAAEATFKEALAQPGLTDDALVALRYELGLLYDVAGRPLEALESYQDVADRAPQFRDVAKKLKSLRRSLGLDEQPDPPPASRAGRDRISYV